MKKTLAALLETRSSLTMPVNTHSPLNHLFREHGFVRSSSGLRSKGEQGNGPSQGHWRFSYSGYPEVKGGEGHAKMLKMGFRHVDENRYEHPTHGHAELYDNGQNHPTIYHYAPRDSVVRKRLSPRAYDKLHEQSELHTFHITDHWDDDAPADGPTRLHRALKRAGVRHEDTSEPGTASGMGVKIHYHPHQAKRVLHAIVRHHIGSPSASPDHDHDITPNFSHHDWETLKKHAGVKHVGPRGAPRKPARNSFD